MPFGINHISNKSLTNSNLTPPLAPYLAVFKHLYDDFYVFFQDGWSGWCLAHTAGSLSEAKCIESNDKFDKDGK